MQVMITPCAFRGGRYEHAFNASYEPILRRFGLEATVRPSLAFYNTPEEVDRMDRSGETAGQALSGGIVVSVVSVLAARHVCACACGLGPPHQPDLPGIKTRV
jgi:hypothetical protein